MEQEIDIKSKIEVKTKEEVKKDNDNWLAEVLKRGYTLIKDGSGKVVKQGSGLHSGEEVAIMFTDVSRKAHIV